jgi:hypothetical protein
VKRSNFASSSGAALADVAAEALVSAGARDPSLPAEHADSAAAPAKMRNHLLRADRGDMQVLR